MDSGNSTGSQLKETDHIHHTSRMVLFLLSAIWNYISSEDPAGDKHTLEKPQEHHYHDGRARLST